MRTARVVFNRETSFVGFARQMGAGYRSKRREKTSVRIDWPILQAHPGSAPSTNPAPDAMILSLFLSSPLSLSLLAERRADNSN